ncbi:hypothetical protein C2S51_029392 [Perilla frutescens var. frutescens]|nr:hypothetical protein C2S51_029392 [Perilla frutescens var. frutescens]
MSTKNTKLAETTTFGIQSSRSSDMVENTRLEDLQEGQKKLDQFWQAESIKRDVAELGFEEQMTTMVDVQEMMMGKLEHLSNQLAAMQIQLLKEAKGNGQSECESILDSPPQIYKEDNSQTRTQNTMEDKQLVENHAVQVLPLLSKIDFPKFEGFQPRVWILRCNGYFKMMPNIPDEQKIALATINFEGKAALWVQSYNSKHIDITWKQFVEIVSARFEDLNELVLDDPSLNFRAESSQFKSQNSTGEWVLLDPQETLEHTPLLRVEFPKFDGSYPRVWIARCDEYFKLVPNISEERKVTLASVSFEMGAATWFQTFNSRYGSVTWKQLIKVILARFEDLKKAEIGVEVNKHNHTMNYLDYVSKYVELKECMLLFDQGGCSETYAATNFPNQLAEKLRVAVDVFDPGKLEQTMELGYDKMTETWKGRKLKLQAQKSNAECQFISSQALYSILHTKQIKENRAADVLSRVQDKETNCLAVTIVAPSWLQEVVTSYSNDVHCTKIVLEKEKGSALFPKFTLTEGLLKYKGRVVLEHNPELKGKVLHTMHGLTYGGNSGVHGTYVRLKRAFYWPCIKSEVENLVKKCNGCRLKKLEHGLTHSLLQPLPIPTQAFIEGLLILEGKNMDGHNLQILIDMDNPLNFIKEETTKKLDCVIEEATPLLIKMSNGQRLFNSYQAEKFRWDMPGNQGECQAVNNVISLWLQDVLTGYEDDAYFEKVTFSKIYDPVTYPKFTLRLFRYIDRVARGGDQKLREKPLIPMQGTSYEGYSGMNGTYAKLKGVFFQPGIKDVEKLSRTCEVYKLNKPNHVRTQGLLQPLPLLEQPWSQICRDFIEGFSKSAEIDINQVAVKREIQDKRAMLQELKSNLQWAQNPENWMNENPEKGKMCNHHYLARKEPIIVYETGGAKLVKALRNILGVKVAHVSRLDLLKRTPVGHLRKYIVNKSAFKKLDENYGVFDKSSEEQNGYVLARAEMMNREKERSSLFSWGDIKFMREKFPNIDLCGQGSKIGGGNVVTQEEGKKPVEAVAGRMVTELRRR